MYYPGTRELRNTFAVNCTHLQPTRNGIHFLNEHLLPSKCMWSWCGAGSVPPTQLPPGWGVPWLSCSWQQRRGSRTSFTARGSAVFRCLWPRLPSLVLGYLERGISPLRSSLPDAEQGGSVGKLPPSGCYAMAGSCCLTSLELPVPQGNSTGNIVGRSPASSAKALIWTFCFWQGDFSVHWVVA